MQSTHVEGVECAACGFASVPYQSFGCERCGSHGSDLIRREFSGRGELLSRTTVWRSPHAEMRVPYEVGNIRLDDGPVFRARVAGGEDRVEIPVEAHQEGDGLVFRTMEERS